MGRPLGEPVRELLNLGEPVGGLLIFLPIAPQKSHWEAFLDLMGRLVGKPLGEPVEGLSIFLLIPPQKLHLEWTSGNELLAYDIVLPSSFVWLD